MSTSSPVHVEPKAEATLRALTYKSCKRIFDIVFSVLGLALLSPLMLAVAVAVRLSSAGPALYRGRRVGLNGRLFYVLKFRTMLVNADRVGGSCTADGDVRITRVGKSLRKTKLDELPQLLNVLTGEMSFVGPRPELEEFTQSYDARERQVLNVKPGITDLATLWDSDEGSVLAGEPDPERAYREKILPTKLRLQLEYVERASFLLDFRIVIQTIAVVCKRAARLLFSA